MKNVFIEETGPVIKIPMNFLPPLQGWALRLLQDIPEAGFKRGYWISHWVPEPDRGVSFRFGPEMHLVFNSEAQAKEICDELRVKTEVETEVVKIGNPQ
jgi:hypothetical protein